MVKRYLLQTTGRWYFTNAIEFQLFQGIDDTNFYKKFTKFDVFTSGYDVEISVDTWNSSKVVSETV